MRNRIAVRSCFLACALLLGSELFAQPWVALDPRDRAMGGAGVAAAEGGSASYWNPANLARGAEGLFDFRLKSASVYLHGYVEAQARGNVIESFDELITIFDEEMGDIQAAFDAGNANAAQVQRAFEVVDVISNLNERGSGLLGGVGGAADVKLGNFCLSYRFIGLAAATTNVDVSNASLAEGGGADLATVADGLGSDDAPATAFGGTLSAALQQETGITAAQANELAFQAEEALGNRLDDEATQDLLLDVVEATGRQVAGEDETTLSNNKSNVFVRGVQLQEIAFAYGLPLFDNKIRLGIAPKVIIGKTFFRFFDVSDTDEINDGKDVVQELKDTFNTNSKTSTQFSVDAGIAYQPFPFLEFGLAGRNLIPAEFEFVQPADRAFAIPDFEVDPQARAGVLIRPLGWKWLKLAGDFDLTTNQTNLFPGFQERIIGGGFELSPSFWIFQIALRGGVFDNIEESDDGLTYTAGLGIRTGIFYITVQGQIASEDVTVESSGDDDIPSRAGFSAGVGINVRF